MVVEEKDCQTAFMDEGSIDKELEEEIMMEILREEKEKEEKK
jgi:hypothetical protein